VRDWNDLPPSWSLAPLELLAEINPRSGYAVPESPSSPVHFVPMRAVEEEFGGIDISTRRPLSEVQKGYTSFQAGDVLFAKITPCMENGKLAIVPPLDNGIGFGSTEFHVVRSRANVAPKWLAYFLSQSEFRKFARRHMTGTAGQLRVATPWLAKATLPLAPTAEQTRIVDKLEELLSGLDAGVAELKAAQEKLAQYRQSLLKAAVEGQLTAAWREENSEPEEDGAQLLARILCKRRARWEAKQLAKFRAQGKAPPKSWKEKYPEPMAPERADRPMLPVGWSWATIDQLADVGTGVTPLRSRTQYFQSGTIPWVTSGALNDEFVSAAKEYVTELAAMECRLELYPAGSLLVAMYGEGKTRGKCAELLFPATINQAIASLVFAPEANACKDHVKMFLLKSYEQMRERASGGVQPNLNLQIIKSIAIPLPPVSEQVEIARSVSEQLGQAQQQVDAVRHALRQSAAQRKNILKAAFSGQLVPQDPNDEPASVLLERIRAERAEREKPPKTRNPRAAAKEPA
jgi:type I restriction enzyme, S subunit